MGLLGEIYNVFALGYSFALATLIKHKDFSCADWALIGGIVSLNILIKREDLSLADKTIMAATVAFVGLSIFNFLNELRLIPWGYKWRFTGKSLLRGLLGPLLSLLYYPVLFCRRKCVKKALTFSNDAYDGVERARQLQIFELVQREPGARYNLATHDLLRYEGGKWGYDRRVGEIWVRVRFEDLNFNSTDQRLKLQTSGDGTTSLIRAPTLQTTLQDNDSEQGNENDSRHESVNVPVKASCLECIWGDLERGSIPADPETYGIYETYGPYETYGSPVDLYEITITWRRKICRMKKFEWFRCNCFQNVSGSTASVSTRTPLLNKEIKRQQPETCLWNLKCTEVRKWTSSQIHQYMMCLDAWGNHPKQGIWKPRRKPTNQLFRYCYRHDELIAAIDEDKRLTQTQNDGTWYTVV